MRYGTFYILSFFAGVFIGVRGFIRSQRNER